MTLRSSVAHPWARVSVLIACGFAVGCSSGKSDSLVSSDGDGGGPTPPSRVTAFFGGRVSVDLNRNGVIDAGEPGAPSITVQVVDADGQPQVSETDADGRYQLNATVEAGKSYSIAVDLNSLPGTLELSPQLSGDNGSIVVDVPADATGELVRSDLDFGFLAKFDAGVIGDFVWHDLNCDGVQDAGESGINGIIVLLKNAQGLVIDQATTAASNLGLAGHYRFSGLDPAATYIVEVDAASWPVGFTPGPCDLSGADPMLDSNCSPAIVQLSLTDVSIDFGFCTVGNGVIGNFVFLDADGDGIQDPGEVGIDGVTVWLRDASGQIIRTATTTTLAQAGHYRFTGLLAGTYTVELDSGSLPTGCLPSPIGVGGDPALDSNGSPAMVTLATNSSVDETIDFGFVCDFTGSIGDFVWNDLNADGLQDATEPGISGVRVVLRDLAANQIATAWTDALGRYEFGALPEGDYQVEVDLATLPAGASASPCEAGSDPLLDSNCAPAAVTLAHAQQQGSIDFGFSLPNSGSIGDFVWNDWNCNGLQDAGEPGLEGVVLRLKDNTGAVIAMQASDSLGFYSFVGLAPGTYTVDVDPTTLPATFVPTFCEEGSNEEIDSNCLPATVVVPPGGTHCDSIDFGFLPH